jgi:hypothetical protein
VVMSDIVRARRAAVKRGCPARRLAGTVWLPWAALARFKTHGIMR